MEKRNYVPQEEGAGSSDSWVRGRWGLGEQTPGPEGAGGRTPGVGGPEFLGLREDEIGT